MSEAYTHWKVLVRVKHYYAMGVGETWMDIGWHLHGRHYDNEAEARAQYEIEVARGEASTRLLRHTVELLAEANP